jgi:hypothetical protein
MIFNQTRCHFKSSSKNNLFLKKNHCEHIPSRYKNEETNVEPKIDFLFSLHKESKIGYNQFSLQ